MDLNVLYKIPEDQVYQNIKGLVRRNSIDLVLYCPDTSDKYIIKKNLLSLGGLFSKRDISNSKDGGILAISCFYENISSILSIIRDECMCLNPGVLILSTEVLQPHIKEYSTFITTDSGRASGIFVDNEGVNTPNESIVNRLSKTSEVVLCVGDRTLDGAMFGKQMCRNIICFADKGYEQLALQGIRIEE